jgi:hypothetical protein
VIVRIATESQYKLPEDAAEELNDLDNQVVEAIEAGDEDRYHALFEQMLDLVRRTGQPLDEDELAESEVILPPPDTSFVEAAAEFTGEGLIPD